MQYATSGVYASSQDALLAYLDLCAYRPCHHRDCTAGTPELFYCCYHHHLASPTSVTTTGRVEQLEDGPRCLRRLHPRDSHESVVGQLERLADVGQSDPKASGLNDHATSWGWPARQSDALDSEPLLMSVAGALQCPVLLL
jgi:hypothetical protein